MVVEDVPKIKKGSGSTAFRQQNLRAYQPILTPVCVIFMLLLIFATFLPIGIVLEDASNQVISQTVRYDNIPDCAVDDTMNYTQLPRECTINITIENDMQPPIYFYYELRNFYQNHRKYVASKSDTQMRAGGDSTISADCTPYVKHNGSKLLACGLVAGSFFEDRFSATIYRETDSDSPYELCPSCINYGMNNRSAWRENWNTWDHANSWQIEGIAWTSDMDEKFIYVDVDSDHTRIGVRQEQSGLRLPDTDNEDFVVWMRVAAIPDFRKLHRINKEYEFLEGDIIEVRILNWFPVEKFDGQKWITFSTTEWCGTENHSLAWAYIIVACVSIGMTITFAVLLLFGKRKIGDVDQFEWHNKPSVAPLVSVA